MKVEDFAALINEWQASQIQIVPDHFRTMTILRPLPRPERFDVRV
ncbi:MAG: hypothetical protein AABP62_05205 [Planctomycetota bacterium]